MTNNIIESLLLCLYMTNWTKARSRCIYIDRQVYSSLENTASACRDLPAWDEFRKCTLEAWARLREDEITLDSLLGRFCCAKCGIVQRLLHRIVPELGATRVMLFCLWANGMRSWEEPTTAKTSPACNASPASLSSTYRTCLQKDCSLKVYSPNLVTSSDSVRMSLKVFNGLH